MGRARPDDSLDLDTAASRQHEVEMACAQVQEYASVKLGARNRTCGEGTNQKIQRAEEGIHEE